MSECKWGTAVGEYIGKWFSENRPGEAVRILESNADDLGGDLPKRTDCMVSGIKKYVPDTEVALNLTCWLEECGYSIMEDALISHPEINVFLGSDNETTYGAVTALEAAGKTPGKDVIFGCVDSQYRMVELIKQGKVLCTAYVNEVEEGPLLVDTAKKLVEGTFEIGSSIIYENPIIRKANADEYLQLLSKYE
jgi:ribose transport system substrate-binding protein